MSGRMAKAPKTLARYLQRVQALVFQRATLRAALVVLGVGLLMFAAASLYANWSGRGDLSRGLWLAGMALCAWVGANERWVLFDRKRPSIEDCARVIAQVQDPPTQSLRQDIAAAWSLQHRTQASLHSSALEELYVARVHQRLEQLPPEQAIPAPPLRPVLFLVSLGLIAVAGALLFLGPACVALLEGQDNRKSRPPEVFWRSLGVELEFPLHTQIDPQRLEPVAGQLRVPAGTRIRARLTLPKGAHFSELRLRDQLTATEWPLQRVDRPKAAPSVYVAELFVESPANFSLLGVDKESSKQRPKHAAAFSLLPIQDQPASLELAPQGAKKRGDRDASLDVNIDAHDDFGLRQLTLYYQSPDDPPAAVDIPLKGQPRSFTETFSWDLSTIPIQQRADLVYWIEARDNDPRLDPKDQKPGKISRSSRRTLILEDARAQHQSLLRQLATLRDQSVDLLAHKMRPIFREQPAVGLEGKLEVARSIHERSTQFLTNLARLISLLQKDKFAARSTLRVLGEVHRRTRAQHELSEPILRFIYANRTQDKASQMPEANPFSQQDREDYPRGIRLSSDRLREALNEWTKLAPAAEDQLQDDVIRLDDLVDSELVEQLQTLVASLRRAQRKLVQLLEKLDIKNENAKARIAQLEARIKLDMERISELRALLREEVDPGFFNEDALAELAARMKHTSIQERLANNDLAGAKESANAQLSQMDAVQQKLEQQEQTPAHLTPKEKAQRFLRRELSAIKDAQANLTERSPTEVQPTELDSSQDQRVAQTIDEGLGKIDDTKLNAPGRKAFQAAKDALERLTQDDTDPQARHHAREALRHHLDQAWRGATDKEQRALSTLRNQAIRHSNRASFTPDAKDKQRATEQKRIATKLQRASEDPNAQAAREPELDQLISQALESMKQSREATGQGRHVRSKLSQDAAQDELQEALNRLSDAPPPPPPKGSQEVSMEAKQDLSLRQAVLDALKQQPESLRPSTRAYYESLLEP